MSFNVAVAGKGGSGKTSIASLVIRYLIKNGKNPILAVDADPNANLGDSLGLGINQTIGSIIANFNEEKINIPPGMTKEAYDGSWRGCGVLLLSQCSPEKIHRYLIGKLCLYGFGQ